LVIAVGLIAVISSSTRNICGT